MKRNIQDCQKRCFPQVSLTLIAPFEKENEEFSTISDRVWNGSLGLVKLLDRTHLIDCFKLFCEKAGTVISDIDYSQLNDEELLLAILGRDGTGAGERRFLPLFLWGFDSI